MTTTIETALPIERVFGFDGLQLAGGLVYTYQAKSSIPAPTYKDLAGNFPNTNPIVLDSTGAAIIRWLPQAYKIVVTDSNGTVLFSRDDFYPPFTNITDIAAALNPQTAQERAAGITPTNYAYPPGHLHRYGAVGDNVADDSVAVSTAFASGYLVTGIGGLTYYIGTGTIQINTTSKAQLYDVAFRTGINGGTAINIASDDVTIAGLELFGRGGGTYTDNERLIDWIGGDVNHYRSGLQLINCYLHDVGKTCFWSVFGKKALLQNCRFEKYAYSAVHVLSGNDWLVDGGSIDANFPVGANNNAYGISFTRDPTISDDLTVVPRSKNCMVIGMTIKNIPLWSALDTHGGEEIVFSNNIVENCKMGITIGSCPGVSGAALFGPKNCKSIGNTITNSPAVSGNFGVGINGAIVATGTIIDAAEGCATIGDKVTGCGVTGAGTAGGFQFSATRGMVVSGCQANKCFPNAFVFYHDNYGFTMTGCEATDPFDSTVTNSSGVMLNAGYNTGTITGNSFIKNDTTLGTTVGKYAINMLVSTSSTVVVGPNYSTMTTYENGIPSFALTALTDSTGGVVSSTIGDVGGSFNQTTLNNRFASLTAAINAIETRLRDVGMLG